MNVSENPYVSPASTSELARSDKLRRSSWRRGILHAMIWGVLGFAFIPLFAALGAYSHYYASEHWGDFEQDLRRIPITFPGALVLAVVFGSAALLNQAPATQIGFVESLKIVGVAAIPCAIALAIAMGPLAMIVSISLGISHGLRMGLAALAALALLLLPIYTAVYQARNQMRQDRGDKESASD